MANALNGQIFISVVDTYQNVDLNRGSCNDTEGRTLVDISRIPIGRQAVLLIFGQSNGANSGEKRYACKHAVYNFNFFDGRCYKACDPLLGATENKGNFAGRLGDMLIESGLFDSVILVPISVGGSRAEEWTAGGARHRRLQVAVKRVADAGLAFTHLLWHQGETNARHDPNPAIYAASLRNIRSALTAYGVTAPMYVAQATVCNSAPNEGIRGAQRSVVCIEDGIYPGPDTDTIGVDQRFDGCHMSEAGLIRHAELWTETISSCLPG